MRERLGLSPVQGFASLEHRQLEHRSIKLPVLIHSATRHGLNHEVDVPRSAAAVGPKRHVHLLGPRQIRDDRPNADKKRPKRLRLCFVELPQVHDVTPGLDDECPDAQRAYTVLDDPPARLEDGATGKVEPSLRQVAGEAAFHDSRA